MTIRFLKKAPAIAGISAIAALSLAPISANATVSPSATNAGAWLAGELTDGVIHNNGEFAFDDYGLTFDVLLGLQNADTQGPAQVAIVHAMSKNVKKYVFNTPSTGPEDGIWAGSAAKALTAIQEAGPNATQFGGVDLVSVVEATVVTSGPDTGRLKDKGIPGFPDPAVPADYSNLLYQAFGLRGLAEAGSPKVAEVRDFLLDQQCAPGYFRLYFNKCSPNVDATAQAIIAMTEAKADGVGGLDLALADATDWLVAHQRDDGSFGGGTTTEASNSNSTGLAAHALAIRGETNAARRAAEWVYELQVPARADGKLQSERGAVALSREAYEAGVANGIPAAAEDQWRRATAQAMLGLIHVDPSTIETVVKEKIVKVPVPVAAPRTGNSSPVQVSDGVSIAEEAATSTGKAGQFLAEQLSDGDHVEVDDDGTTYTDYGLTADTALGLRLLGEQPQIAANVTELLLTDEAIDAFAHGAPYEDEAAYAEPLAKLIILGTLQKDRDLKQIDALAAELVDLQDATGAFVDHGKYADDSGSIERHVTAVLAAMMAGEDDAAQQGIAYLESMQCADGGFPGELVAGCQDGVPAATGWALQALNALAADGVAEGALLSDVPAGWPAARTTTASRAVAALQKSVHVDGSIASDTEDPGLQATAAAAAGRQAAGLDTTASARYLAAAQLDDGGLPKQRGVKEADLAVTAASAAGLARTSWLSTPRTGLMSASTMPIAEVAGETKPAAADTSVASSGFDVPRWVAYLVLALLVLFAIASIALAIAQLRHRSKPAV